MTDVSMQSLRLNAQQVEDLIAVPKRRVNEMAERGIIPSEVVGGGKIKVRRSFAFTDLDLIKQQYENNYPHRRPGENTKTSERLASLERDVAWLVDAVQLLCGELGMTAPTRDTPGEGTQEPSPEQGD